MIVDTIYDIGDMVYLKTDPEQKKRIVTAIIIRGERRQLAYECFVGGAATWHYAMEMSDEKDGALASI